MKKDEFMEFINAIDNDGLCEIISSLPGSVEHGTVSDFWKYIDNEFEPDELNEYLNLYDHDEKEIYMDFAKCYASLVHDAIIEYAKRTIGADDTTESYRVDRVHYDINDNKVYGDMGYSFNDFEGRFPCSNYESDEEFKAVVLDAVKNCDEEQDDSEEIAIYKAYKEYGYHGELELIYTVACCSKGDAEKYGIKADAFTK